MNVTLFETNAVPMLWFMAIVILASHIADLVKQYYFYFHYVYVGRQSNGLDSLSASQASNAVVLPTAAHHTVAAP